MRWLIAVTVSAVVLVASWFVTAKRKAKKQRLANAILDDELDSFRGQVKDVRGYDSKHPGEPTLLMRAAGLNAIGILSFLLKQGVDVNARDAEGRTALMYAAQWNAPYDKHGFGVIKALLAAGADINAADHKGRTTLMFAAAHAGAPATLLPILFSHRADVRAKDKYGLTAAKYWYNFRTYIGRENLGSYMDTAKPIYELFRSAGDEDVGKGLDADYSIREEAITTIGGVVLK